MISGHSTVVWPALPVPEAAQMAALLTQLDDSQWWTPGQLFGMQLTQAGALLHNAYRHLAFYRDRLAQAGFVPGKPVTPAVWARIPVLTRAELQAAGPALYSPVVPESHGKIYEIASSGSTGRPVTARGTALAQVIWNALTLREHFWHRRDLSADMAAIRAFPSGVATYPEGASSPVWGRAMTNLYPTGHSNVLTIVSSTEQQLEWLQRVQPGYLLTYPSALRELLLLSRDRGVSFPKLREVRTISELLPPETRELCRDVWGVGIVDLYSTQENGYLAFQCPEHEHYHVQSEAVLLEVLDDEGRPCRPGEVGQVVVTQLLNFAMPMIRYAIGDMAEVGAGCPCGRGLPVLRRVLGRVRNLLVYPDGRKSRLPVNEIWQEDSLPIRQMQIVQHGVHDIEIRLVPARPFSPAEEELLCDLFRRCSGHAFATRLTYLDEIPRGPGGKFEDFRCEIPQATGAQP